MLAILSPLFAFIALRIKLEAPGPVFFRQERIGWRGRRFRIYKFRSMYLDADARKSDVGHLNKHDENGPTTHALRSPNAVFVELPGDLRP
jgi:lipopolysaccharide/colanic/teichoic acid biosynthesis glycosyltransferase